MWDDGTLGTILHNTRGGEIYEILWTIQSCVCYILSKTGDTELIQEKVEPIILNLHLKKSLFPCILIHWCISKCIVQCLADVSLASHCTHSCLLYLSVSAPCPPVSLLSGNIFYPISDWVSNSQNADSGNNLVLSFNRWIEWKTCLQTHRTRCNCYFIPMFGTGIGAGLLLQNFDVGSSVPDGSVKTWIV